MARPSTAGPLPSSYWASGSTNAGPSGPIRPGLGARSALAMVAQAEDDANGEGEMGMGMAAGAGDDEFGDF